MTRRSPWLLLAFLALAGVLGGCGQEIVPKQVDEPCTRTGQCELGLECTAGVCRPIPDAGVDAGS